MKGSVTIIGAGIAGLEAAAILSARGILVTVIEKDDQPGGHVARWESLFPNRRKSAEVISHLADRFDQNTTILLNSRIQEIRKKEEQFVISIEGMENICSDALLIATGFELFDCRKKEEYGYGIYDNVMTSAEVEKVFLEKKNLVTCDGRQPRRIGIIHCVGSRDEKAGNLYCSKVCCITGVKQGIEIKERLPETEIFCFYMDLRMFDRHFEEMYLEAQQKWDIHFIRGRLSEAAENADRTITLKVEDTLAGLPMKLNVDLVILLAGFIPAPGTATMAGMLSLQAGDDGFLNPLDEHIHANNTAVPGLFLAGAVKGPSSVQNTISDAQAAAVQIENYLNSIR